MRSSNYRFIIVLGETGSGKSYGEAALCDAYPDEYRRTITTTTRPIRVKETNNISCYFVSEKEMLERQELFVELNYVDGHYYGKSAEEMLKDSRVGVSVVEPKGAVDILAWANKNEYDCFIVLFDVPIGIREENMRRRGDSEEMIKKRRGLDAEIRAGIDAYKISPNLLITTILDDVGDFIRDQYIKHTSSSPELFFCTNERDDMTAFNLKK
jgi:guanylate kinase